MPNFLSTWMFWGWVIFPVGAVLSLWGWFIERRKERDWRYSGKYWLGYLAPSKWYFIPTRK